MSTCAIDPPDSLALTMMVNAIGTVELLVGATKLTTGSGPTGLPLLAPMLATSICLEFWLVAPLQAPPGLLRSPRLMPTNWLWLGSSCGYMMSWVLLVWLRPYECAVSCAAVTATDLSASVGEGPNCPPGASVAAKA